MPPTPLFSTVPSCIVPFNLFGYRKKQVLFGLPQKNIGANIPPTPPHYTPHPV